MKFEEYSPIQRKYLQAQAYTDTSAVPLLVIVPEKAPMLCRSLQRQIHRNFEVATASAIPDPICADGVVVFAEDQSCLPTALSEYAAAIRDGADLAYADATFGSLSETACYYSEIGGLPERLCCVALSATLFRSCSKGLASLSACIREARRQAEKTVHIAAILHWLRRAIQPTDVYPQTGKRAFVFSHEFSMTGAPIVLAGSIPLLKKMGYSVAVIGPKEDGCLPLFLQGGATVLTNADCCDGSSEWDFAFSADFVLANTIVARNFIRFLSGAPTPVLWWLHDAFVGYPYINAQIPYYLAPNIRIYTVGSHAEAALHSVRPNFPVQSLYYGLSDYALEDLPTYDLSFAAGKRLFVHVGTFEERKGQDILAEAIGLLREEELSQAAFLFVGKPDDHYYPMIRTLCELHPENVFFRAQLARDEMKSVLKQCDCVVCSSRDDPLPTFITEGMIFGKPFIVSEHTGTAGLTEQGVNGFVYHEDSAEELAEQLRTVLNEPECLQKMQPKARELYERYFSLEAFARAFAEAVQTVCRFDEGEIVK